MPWKETEGRALTRNSSEIDLGPRLASVRARRGLSQGTVARLAGLPASYLSRIETGHVHPTFGTVKRVLDAMHSGFEEITAPDDLRPTLATVCPVTGEGQCLLELIRSEIEVARAEGREVYSLREVKLLRGLARFMRKASPERVRAIEMLLEELLENTR